MANAILCETAVKIADKENGKLAYPGARTWGVRIKVYLAAIGLTEGHDYCAAFVYWSFQQAANQVPCPNPLPKTGLPSKFHAWAKQTGSLVDTPIRGDIYIEHDMSHTGIVRITPGGADLKAVETIEGNTWTHPTNWGVWRRTKNLSNAYFVRV